MGEPPKMEARKSPPKTPPKITNRSMVSAKIDEVSANAIWKEFCSKLEPKPTAEDPSFTINPFTMVPIADKPTKIRPSIRVTQKEYDESKEVIGNFTPIKHLDAVPPDKYEMPMTSAQEYGWCSEPLIKQRKLFEYPHSACPITKYAEKYIESMHTTPFSKKGFISRKGRLEIAAAEAAKTSSSQQVPIETTAPNDSSTS